MFEINGKRPMLPTMHALIFLDENQNNVLIARFKNAPDTAWNDVAPQQRLLAPENLPDFQLRDHLTRSTILFISYSATDTLDTFEGVELTVMDVTCASGAPAAQFVREHVEGGTMQGVAHDLYTACRLQADKAAEALDPYV